MRLAKLLAIYSAAFGISAVVTVACISVDYGDIAFLCSPKGADPNCPSGYICCSDDPATLEFDDDDNPSPVGAVPGYGDHADERGYAEPLFSGTRNASSSSGVCIKEGTLQGDAGLTESGAVGCPIPCNPHWDDDDLEAVCGTSALCCPTVGLHESDCVLDPDDDCYRPATGSDILSGDNLTNWSSSSHMTHQDPGGEECEKLFGKGSDKWRECLKRLTVADARGFCVAESDSGSGCGEFVDACEQKNQAEGLSCD